MQRAQALHQVGLIVAVEAVRVSKERDWRGDTCDGRRLRQRSGRPDVDGCGETADVTVGKPMARGRGCRRGRSRRFCRGGRGGREGRLTKVARGGCEVLWREGRIWGRKACEGCCH